ncbi:MAG: ABC transporter substrate-binding protein [Proteobacteria bacterium]|nr:MAG: ABC transporter substrate-binding protein [Pseudomonadota bacterium]QKK11529.1 MAG: ABC transporter substrate-binding protein [Pseudomonadota bacterium]
MLKKLGQITAFAAGIFAVAQGPATAAELTGVTDTEIHIGQWGPQTGPAAPWGSVARGTGMLFQMINEEGGIHGRKIVYHMFDDQYNPAKTVAGVKELVEKEPGIFGFASGVGTSPGLAVKDYLMERGIPWVGPAAGSLHWITPPQKYLFSLYPLYADEAKLLVRHLVQKEGKKNIAILYASDEYGENGHRGAVEEMTRLGIKPAIEVPLNQADRDLKSHVLKLKQSGADAVVMWVNPTHAVITLKTAAALQFAPQWATSSTLSDAPLMHTITGGLWKNIIFASFSELPDADTPAMKKYRDAFAKYAQQGERWGVFFMAGIGFVEPMVEGLRRAGRDLTREKFVSAMESIKDFKGILGNISFGPGERQGQRAVFLAKTDDTGVGVVQLTPWTEPK